MRIVMCYFKFHYVSINSKLAKMFFDAVNTFKFHYVSINSQYHSNMLL